MLRAFLARRGLTPAGLLTAIITVVLSIYLIYAYSENKCNVVSILLPLLRTAAKHLSSVKGTNGYWLDYGSLLGAWRDGGIIPWEFDLDMGVDEADCDKYVALRDAMKEDGLILFKRGDWVAQKQNRLLGYDGYLHKACARIYDSSMQYYIDFDWNRRYTYAAAQQELKEAHARGERFDLPAGYKESDGDVLCNVEAWERGTSDGCRLASWIFPLRPIDVLGVAQWAPADPEANLRAMYGDDWMVPQPKGYKILLCTWMPTTLLPFLCLWMLLTALPYVVYRASPLLCHRCMVLIGRRNVTAKYTLVPLGSPTHSSPGLLPVYSPGLSPIDSRSPSV